MMVVLLKAGQDASATEQGMLRMLSHGGMMVRKGAGWTDIHSRWLVRGSCR